VEGVAGLDEENVQASMLGENLALHGTSRSRALLQ
jgi:hypothetical protein